MESNEFSLKKRVIIVCIFIGFFLVLSFVALSAKKNTPHVATFSATPTLVPVEAGKENKNSAKDEKIESSSAVRGNNLGDISFSYLSKKIPSTSTVYVQAPTSISTDTISKLQQQLIAGGKEQIINTPKGKVVFMQSKSKTLTIYLYSRYMVFSDSNPSQNQERNYMNAASFFIKTLSLPLDASSPTVKYFSNNTSDLVEVPNQNQADIIDVSFKENVKGLTVFRQFGSDAAAHAWIDKEGRVIKFTYVFAPQYEPQKSILLPTLVSAEEMVRSNKGIIVSLKNDYLQRETKTITSTTFTSVEVGYFSDFEGATLKPIFVFKGSSLIDGTNTPIIVYVPIAN